MKNVQKLMLVAIVGALAGPALAGAVPQSDHARAVAGVLQSERVASYVDPRNLKEYDSGYGRAGGALGQAPERTHKPPRKTDVAMAVGSAGRPGLFRS